MFATPAKTADTAERSLINRAKVRQLALDTYNGHIPKDLVPHYGKERVSPDFLERMEAKFRALIVQEINAMPTHGADRGGKTIK